MAVSTLLSNAKGFEGNRNGGMSHRAIKGREGTGTQSWTYGAVLIRASGTVIEAGSAAVADILGVATAPSLGVANSEAIFLPATPDMVFEATLENKSATNHALLITDMYTDFAVDVDSSNNWYVDFNETTNTAVTVIAPLNWFDVDAATVRSRVLVVFLEDTTIYNT